MRELSPIIFAPPGWKMWKTGATERNFGRFRDPWKRFCGGMMWKTMCKVGKTSTNGAELSIDTVPKYELSPVGDKI